MLNVYKGTGSHVYKENNVCEMSWSRISKMKLNTWKIVKCVLEKC